MRIESYGFGEIVISGKVFRSDVIIFPDRVDDSWWRNQSHLLQLEDLTAVLRAKPEVLIVGTGYYGIMKVSPELKDKILADGIEIFDVGTRQAVSLYNSLYQRRNVIAALHLTC